MSEARLIEVTRSGQVTLPASAQRQLRVEEGDCMEVRVTEDNIILTPKTPIYKSRAHFWTPEWQAVERKARTYNRGGPRAGVRERRRSAGRLRAARDRHA